MTAPVSASFPDILARIEKFQASANQPWYRGCSKASYQLTATIARDGKAIRPFEQVREIEARMSREFAQRARPFMVDHPQDDWDLMFYMQHYGVPTRLLDWSQILLFEYRGFPTSTKKKDLDAFYETDANNEIFEAAGLKCNAHLDSMCQIFVEKDLLLSNSGQVPAFYWFIKLAPFESHSFVRDFLIEFYERRMESRQAQAENRLKDVDARLARYDVLDRNTNDAGSQRARIAILLDAFSDYLAMGNETALLEPKVSDAHRSFLLEMKESFGHDWHY